MPHSKSEEIRNINNKEAGIMENNCRNGKKETIEFWLEGNNEALCRKIVIRDYPYNNDRTYEEELGTPYTRVDRFPLHEVTTEELKERRASGIPGFVVKENGKYYYGQITSNMRFIGDALGEHMCAPNGTVCRRMSALPDEQGGCEKIRGYSSGIEQFGCITKGFESFNTKQDSLIVSKCTNFTPEQSNRNVSTQRKNAAKLSLYQEFWPNVETLAEGRKILREKEMKERRLVIDKKIR